MEHTKNKKENPILITGGLGFIGSVYSWFLNRGGQDNIVLCDYFRKQGKWKNIRNLNFYDIILPEQAVDFIEGNLPEQKFLPESIIHLGACSSTTEEDMDFLFRNNYEFSKNLWQVAVKKKIPFFYASSAATYGNGIKLEDFRSLRPLNSLCPLNKYGYSKQLFDLWVKKQVAQGNTPPIYAGIKFFNVFGPHEYHKGAMASVVYHAYQQIKTSGKVKLFKSYHPDYEHGKQVRDFVYIKDVCQGMFLITNKLAKKNSQKFLYNLGSGEAHTFVDLVTPIFTALKLKSKVEYIEMPELLRLNYQYFTQAQLDWDWDQDTGRKPNLNKAVIDYVEHLESEPYLTSGSKDSYLG